MSYTNGLDNPELYFQTKLYTGNGSTQSITLDGDEDMQPDWVWIKSRGDTSNHRVYDSVRGATKVIYSNLTNVEGTDSNGVTAFNSDGFSLGNEGQSNGSGVNFASWNWKAGTSFTNDASATGIGTIDSTGSVNTTAGFSIVSYTGNGTSGTEVAHGLGSTPDMYITKNRSYSSGYSWGVYHKDIADNKGLFLDLTSASTTGTGFRDSTAPTSSVFTLGGGSQPYRYTSNKSSDTYIGYFFKSVQGYSKFGSYTGNGNADGTFVYTGFNPAFVIIKRTDTTSEWHMIDNKRNTFNTVDKVLSPNTSGAEATTGSNPIDFLSNGFKTRGSGTQVNASGGTYIYMAFAENPFVTSTSIPTTAR